MGHFQVGTVHHTGEGVGATTNSMMLDGTGGYVSMCESEAAGYLSWLPIMAKVVTHPPTTSPFPPPLPSPSPPQIKFIVDGQWVVDRRRPVVYTSSGNQNNVLVVV